MESSEESNTSLTIPDSKWYNPDHPDADWSGFVKPCQSRKHPSETPQAMLVQISPTNNNGICPSDGAETTEWTKPGRKMEFGKGSDCVNMNNNSSKRSPTLSLIGGPTPVLDPSKVGSVHWETEAQAAMRQHGTRVGQLTTYGRSIHIRGRKETIPAFESAHGFDHDVIRRENPYELNDGIRDDDVRNTETGKYTAETQDNSSSMNLIGYRSHQGGAAKSYLTGLGKHILDKVEVAAAQTVSTAPFATDGNTTDPYLTSVGERRKDLLLENYSIAVPGYTGKRNFAV